MTKSNIILENENILLIANEVVIEGLFVLKINKNGELVLSDIKGKSVALINSNGYHKSSAFKKVALKSLTIKIENITLKSEDVEIIPIVPISIVR